MKTPYFLISKQKLDDNISSFQTAFEKLWPYHVFSYSVKTNSLPWLLSFINSEGISAEVVSDEEYSLALNCGFLDNSIIFNGPIKGETIFERAINNNAIINLDSKRDLLLLEKYQVGDGSNIGVRINIPPEIFDERDIDYTSDGFRFGFSDKSGDLKRAVHTIRKVYGNCRFGLHLHVNSITRSVNVYSAIAEYAVYIMKKYDINPSFIDIGGGFFGGIPGKPTPQDYISSVQESLKGVIDPQKTKLIIEPGSAIIGSAVDLHTSVVDVKDTEKSRIVTIDGSRIHIDPLWIKSKYLYSDSSDRDKYPKQIVCGYTCMDHDRLMTIKNESELRIGDEIVFHRVGAYSMTFGGMFIKYYPDVYVQEKDKIIKVRNKSGVDDYIHIHS